MFYHTVLSNKMLRLQVDISNQFRQSQQSGAAMNSSIRSKRGAATAAANNKNSNQQHLRRLRHFKICVTVIVTLIVVVLLGALWLVCLHVSHKSRNIDGFQEFFCIQSNKTCQALLCPTG